MLLRGQASYPVICQQTDPTWSEVSTGVCRSVQEWSPGAPSAADGCGREGLVDSSRRRGRPLSVSQPSPRTLISPLYPSIRMAKIKIVTTPNTGGC